MRVLIVDDLEPNRKILSAMMHARGCDVEVAESGEAAIESAHRCPPNLILLDMMMPGLSGPEVCTALKDSDRLKNIPVVVVSANEASHDRQSAMRAGADQYVLKPMSPSDIDAAIRLAKSGDMQSGLK